MKLVEVTPFKVHNQRDLADTLKPVDLLAARCDRLKYVVMPAVITKPSNPESRAFSAIPVSLTTQYAFFAQPRYSFALLLTNTTLDSI